MLKIALLSPDQSADSSTFIQAHKRLLDGKISYFFKNWYPIQLEGHGRLYSLPQAFFYILNNKIFRNPLNFKQQALKKAFITEGVEVALVEYGVTAVSVLPICRALNIPMIVIFHGFDAYEKPVLEKYMPQYIEIFKYASGIVAVSQHMKQKLISLGCPAEKTVWNPCAPNDIFFNIKNTCTEKMFVAVGRFVEKKSPISLLLAFEKVLKIHADARLIWGGEGTLLTETREKAVELGINHAITFLGFVTTDQIIEMFSTALAFVQHSVTDRNGDSEGTPVAVLEASAAALPVVSTFHTGIPDVIVNDKTGFLVAEYDIDGMADAMCQLANNFNMAREMGHAGRDFVRTHFTMTKHIAILDDLIKNAVKTSNTL